MEELTNYSLEEAAMSDMASTRNSEEKAYLMPAAATFLFILFLLALPFAAFASTYDWGSAFQLIQDAFADASRTGVLWFNADVTLTIGLYGLIALTLSIAALVYAFHTHRKTLPEKRSVRKKTPIIWATILLAANLFAVTGLWIVTTPPVCTRYAVDGSAPDQCGIPIRPGVHVIDPFH